jgi:hypothetical protein
VILGIAHDPSFATEPSRDLTLWNVLPGIVRPFAVNVGPKPLEELAHVVALEYDDQVNPFERGHDLGAFARGKDRPAHSFSSRGRGVAVHSHHEEIPLRPRPLEVPHMAHVKKIEVPVRENDPLSFLSRLPNQDFGSIE